MVRKMLGLVLAGILSLIVLHPSHAQDQAKPRRVGVLMSGSLTEPLTKRLLEALADGLREQGWEDRRNLLIEARFAASDPARLPELAAELVALKVDAIVAGTTQIIEAARRKTAT